MLPNLLIALGLVLVLLGAYLKMRGPAEPPPAVGIANTTAPPAEVSTPELSAEEKGVAFEQWVADRFPKERFRIKHWRSDKMSPTGQYAESNKDPDLELDLLLGRNSHPFAVECKWRADLDAGTMQIAKSYQVVNYRKFAERSKRPVFIVVGVGGEPSKPESLFVVPLQRAGNGTIGSLELLTNFKQTMSRQSFFFDHEAGTLRY